MHVIINEKDLLKEASMNRDKYRKNSFIQNITHCVDTLVFLSRLHSKLFNHFGPS